MKEYTPEYIQNFRDRLRREMFGPQEWYKCSSINSKDIVLCRPECPYAINKKGTVSEQRYVWWINHPEDPIEYNEMIHHKNGNRQDNRIENLEKVKMKQHAQRHKELKKLNGHD